MSDIFISYSREDAKFVEALIIALIDYGWSVWSDKSGISEGRPFDQEIENAISEATVALVVWSQSSIKSRWVRAEAAYALDKNKLIPVSAENVDPPLQFLHIQGVSLVNWSQTTNDAAFKKLVATLSQRLDRVGRIPQATLDAILPTKVGASRIGDVFNSWRGFRNIVFPPVSRGFNDYYTSRTFFITQFACIFTFCIVTMFGMADFFAQAGGVEQTRFRFMVTGPSLLIMLALSFTPFAKRYSQSFALAFCCLGQLINFKSLQLVGNAFPINTGAPTTGFLITIAVCTILPLRTTGAAILGILAFLMHEDFLIRASTPVPANLFAGYSICVLTASLSLIAVAYFRERVLRRCFGDFDEALIKTAELKGSLMTLAVQRNQSHTQDRASQTIR